MTPRAAFDQAVRECKREYESNRAALLAVVQTAWKTPDEVDDARKGLCRDFAIWTCARTWDLCGGLVAPDEILMVMGHVDARSRDAGAWHAWNELSLADGVTWGDPDPTFAATTGTPEGDFGERIPVYGMLFDGTVLDQEFAYRRRA